MSAAEAIIIIIINNYRSEFGKHQVKCKIDYDVLFLTDITKNVMLFCLTLPCVIANTVLYRLPCVVSNIKVGQKLVGLSRDSRVGVLTDDSRSLHLYINGQDQGVAASHLPQSCFAFFDDFGPYRQVRLIFDILTDR